MLIGARTAAWASQFPYPTDGLIVCYDGIWNGGVGVHNTTGLVWKDLSGNGMDATFNGSESYLEWGNNYGRILKTSSVSSVTAFDFTMPLSVIGGLENLSFVCVTGKSTTYLESYAWPYILGLGQNKYSGFQNISGGLVYGFGKNRKASIDLFVNANATMLTIKDCITNKFYYDNASIDVSYQYTPGTAYATLTTNQLMRNLDSKVYAFLVYDHELSETDWNDIRTKIYNRFSLT